MTNKFSSEMLTLAECEKAFAISAIPVWVADVETLDFLWLNEATIHFWQAESERELRDREMLANIPQAVLVRIRRTIERVLSGEIIEEDWTFYPKGKPTPTLLHLRAIELPDGRVAMLNQAVQLGAEIPALTLRTLVMSRLSGSPVVFVNGAGEIWAQNSESLIQFENAKSWCDWLERPDVAKEILDDALRGNTVFRELEVQSAHGQQIHAVRAYALRDPVSGDLGVLIQHNDVTEKVIAQRLVQEHVAKLEEQKREILALSTPFLEVGANTLALPLTGQIDETRAQEITTRLLEAIANRGIRSVILDMTGVVSVESTNLLFLRRLVAAISLLGARPIITGIRSDLARMLAASDESLSGITIKRSLAEGLQDKWFQEQRRT